MRLRILLSFMFCFSLVFFFAGAGAVSAQEKTFALVPKVQHPFFELAHEGCIQAEKELGGFKCLYIGPVRSSEEEQIQIIQDLVTRRVDGLAIAPANAPVVGRALRRAREAGMNVITFDSDLLPRDLPLRRSYVGTRNYEIGVALAKLLLARKPGGGTLAVQSGGPSAANLQERLQGLRDTLGSSWKEVPGTPVYCNDDSLLAVQQMEDLLGKYSALDAFIAIGGWPQFPQQAYRKAVRNLGERYTSGKVNLLIADTLKVQMDLLAEGLSQGQVGQRPREMGYRSMQVLKDLSEGKTVEEYYYTGLDICTHATLTTCLNTPPAV